MLYQTLEVSKKATEEEIRTAYRQLALKHHPDKNHGTTSERFQAIQQAYEVLGDKDKRAEYDAAMRKKQERLKGFVRPKAFSDDVSKPFKYKLPDGSIYTFESSSDRVKCRLHSGDMIAFNSGAVKTFGMFIGMAADDYLYWIKDNTNYAQRLCKMDSSMAMTSISLIQRANLEPHRATAARTSRRPAGGDSDAKTLYQTLRKKEMAKVTSTRLKNTIEEEEEERASMDQRYSAEMDRLYTNVTLILRALERKIPLPEHMWRFMGYSFRPKMFYKDPSERRNGEAEPSPSSECAPGLHEFSSMQTLAEVSSSPCRTPPPCSSPTTVSPPTAAAAGTAATAPLKEPLPADNVYQAFTQRLCELDFDGGDSPDGLRSSASLDSRIDEADSNTESTYSEVDVGCRVSTERLPPGGAAAQPSSMPVAAAAAPHKLTGQTQQRAPSPPPPPPAAATTPHTGTSEAVPTRPPHVVPPTATAAAAQTAQDGGPAAVPPDGDPSSLLAKDIVQTSVGATGRSNSSPHSQPSAAGVRSPPPPGAAPPSAQAKASASITNLSFHTPRNATRPTTTPRKSTPVVATTRASTDAFLSSVRVSNNNLNSTNGSVDVAGVGDSPDASTSRSANHSLAPPPVLQRHSCNPVVSAAGDGSANGSAGRAASLSLPLAASPFVPPFPQMAFASPDRGVIRSSSNPQLHPPLFSDREAGPPSATRKLAPSSALGGSGDPLTVPADGTAAAAAPPRAKPQGRKTPRYMESTKSALKRAQSLQGEELSIVSPAIETLGPGSGTPSPRPVNSSFARARYDSLTADELFAEEAGFMKSFEEKKRKH